MKLIQYHENRPERRREHWSWLLEVDILCLTSYCLTSIFLYRIGHPKGEGRKHDTGVTALGTLVAIAIYLPHPHKIESRQAAGPRGKCHKPPASFMTT
ncbi:hypothetical protein HD806DRAFT_35414 [Xylariaceae sp. AK1471]|nr:hypothetical protein HD806DRAFT_35414 [Xylariaceae sp. AK1471]